MNLSTKDFSSRQEQFISHYLGWDVIFGSGAFAGRPGDIENSEWLGECKTHITKTEKISFKLSHWKKIQKEAGKDLTLDDSIKFDLMASAFTSGSADYVTLFEPTASNIEKLGKGHIVASVGKEAGEIPYTAYFAKKSYIENNQTTIQNFTNAIYKGQKWVKEHTAKEIAEAIQSFFPDTDIDLLTIAIQSYKDIDAWNETPVLKQESFDKLQEVMSLAGELKVKAPYDKIVNNKYAEEVIISKSLGEKKIVGNSPI